MSPRASQLYFIYSIFIIINGEYFKSNATTNNISSVASVTLFPNNCTEHVIPTFNRLRRSIDTITNVSVHKNRPLRPIDPFCVVPDITFNYTFMPDFYCPSMVKDLYCNKTEELQFLHEFYQSLGGDNWFNNTHWLDPNVDYCQWYGIYCCNTNTSYPLYTTCINIIYMNNNNLFGTLPSKWMNSSVLTVFMASINHITGTIPDYHQRLPNVGAFELSPHRLPNYDPETDSISGPLPNWPSAGCMAAFDLHLNRKLDGIIPDWNQLKYLYQIELSSTSLSGTIPSWTQWVWPYQITIAEQFGNLSGTISPFTNAKCPTLNKIYLFEMGLTGTMPPLPPQLPDFPNTNNTLLLRGNRFTGSFPWDSLTTVSFLQINDNEFSGNIVLPYKYRHLTAINISNNSFRGMFPCLMDNHRLEFVDARYNNFDSIATDTGDSCTAWPKHLKQLLLSNNKINAVLNRASRNLTNMSIIDFGNNRFKGTVPLSLVQGSTNGIYLSFYDNDLSCSFPSDDRVFSNGSWLYIGNRMEKPWASYTNQYELALGIVAIKPSNELTEYLVIPSVIGILSFLLYVFRYRELIGRSIFAKRRGTWCIKELRKDEYCTMTAKQQILYIMGQSVLFVTYLLFVGVFMMYVYAKGANFYKCGYDSLQWSITYLSDLSGTGYDEYSYISIVLYCIYSLVCTSFVARLCYLAKYFRKKAMQQPNHEYAQRLLTSHSVQPINEVVPLYGLYNDKQSKCYLCLKTLFRTLKCIFYFILFVVLLFGPMVAYNIYHSIPYSHIKYIPNLSSTLSQNLVIYFFPFLLAIAKFFGIPYAINKMPSLHNHRNTIIYIVRFITMIAIPIVILLIFDDGCFQIWKSLWDYCTKDENGNYIHQQCMPIAAKYNEGYGPYGLGGTYVCSGVCDTTLVPYRCMRRFFEVLGPLYLYKMSIAFWFPLLYGFRQTNRGKSILSMISNYWKKITCLCYCCNDCNNNNQMRDVTNTAVALDVEYMSLVSSLEIVIVFGWALPMLVVLYGITMFGYWCVYAYWFDRIADNIIHNTIKPAIHWLILSLILQHTLATTFYWFTQSTIHGLCCIGIAFINIVLFAFSIRSMISKHQVSVAKANCQSERQTNLLINEHIGEASIESDSCEGLVDLFTDIMEMELVKEIIRNENEYRKYIKQQMLSRRTQQRRKKRSSDSNTQNNEGSNNVPNDDNNAPNDNNPNQNNDNAAGDDGDDDDEKKGDEKKSYDDDDDDSDDDDDDADDDDDEEEEEKTDEERKEDVTIDWCSLQNIQKMRKKADELMKCEQYQIMKKKNNPLTRAELIALSYYTDSDSACYKMKRYHRGLLSTMDWKNLDFHATKGIQRMHKVFHYKNQEFKKKFRNKKLSYLFHGGDDSLNVASQKRLCSSISTLTSFSTCIDIARSFVVRRGSILVFDNVYNNLYHGNVIGADVKWISQFVEEEFILLPMKYSNCRLLSKVELQKQKWNIPENVNVYMTDEYSSNKVTIMISNKQLNYDELRNWFSNNFSDWEESLRTKYLKLFVGNGCKSLEDILLITKEAQLEQIGIEPVFHRWKIMHAIENLRKSDGP